MNNSWRSIRSIPPVKKTKKFAIWTGAKSHGGFTIEKIEWFATNAAEPEPSTVAWKASVGTSPGIPNIAEEQIFAERQTAYTNAHKISDGTPL
jgi:hypothetical protein